MVLRVGCALREHVTNVEEHPSLVTPATPSGTQKHRAMPRPLSIFLHIVMLVFAQMLPFKPCHTIPHALSECNLLPRSFALRKNSMVAVLPRPAVDHDSQRLSNECKSPAKFPALPWSFFPSSRNKVVAIEKHCYCLLYKYSVFRSCYSSRIMLNASYFLKSG